MAPNKPASVIEILSDDEPASEPDATVQPGVRALGKRKLVPDFEEKVALRVPERRRAGRRHGPRQDGAGRRLSDGPFGKTGDARDGKRMRKMRRDARRWYPRVLIICPGSLIENWKNELNRWGWWSIDLFHGSTAQKEDVLGAARAGMLEIMVTTYQTYKNHASSINTIQWDAVVADECHALKRGSAEITKAMNQNNYTELWTLLNWTNPGHFGTAGEWDRTIAGPLRLGQSHDATFYQLRNARITAKKLVTNLLPGFFLRRMKSLIAHQLPKKSDRVVFCPLTEDQRAAYKRFVGQPELELLRTLSNLCACGSGKKRGWCCDARVADGRSWQSVIFPSVTTLQSLRTTSCCSCPQHGTRR
ncbi:stretch responsive protein [Verticillium alfalfae VaMs.102]|uniref:Stretch responsive protein n=1 Tax=Verticillium alfalfae (strain VaMs.102 / ATCC MYA-4576 / FGSC 10136) TaxID=526221 RepID=C9S6C6_VERA1|nr:stretch responsive protein [Verticillium alfalfae VaMs.102]EEY14438.1 stretch responsive protein [Verticillium alfalfae VaMs.102]